MVGTDQPALLRIDHLRQQLLGQEALPVVGAVPALVGGPVVEQRAGRTDGQAQDRLVPDVALGVAEDAVGAGEGPAAERLLEFAHVLGPHHVQHAPGGIVLRIAEGDALQRHLIAPADAHGDGRHDRAEVRAPEDQRSRLSVLDLDGLGPDLHVAPLAVEEVLVGTIRVGLEDEEVRLVGAQGGQAPGDLGRKADQDVGTARHAQAAGVEGLAAEVELVPQRGIADGRLRVADQHGRARRGLLAAHDPGMAELRSGAALGRRHVHFSHQVVLRRVVQDLLHPRIADITPLDDGGIIAHVQPVAGLGGPPDCLAPRRGEAAGPSVAPSLIS